MTSIEILVAADDPAELGAKLGDLADRLGANSQLDDLRERANHYQQERDEATRKLVELEELRAAAAVKMRDGLAERGIELPEGGTSQDAVFAAIDAAHAEMTRAKADKDEWINRHNAEVAWAKAECDKLQALVKQLTAERAGHMETAQRAYEDVERLSIELSTAKARIETISGERDQAQANRDGIAASLDRLYGGVEELAQDLAVWATSPDLSLRLRGLLKPAGEAAS
jgi:chromosome segregation ATPase